MKFTICNDGAQSVKAYCKFAALALSITLIAASAYGAEELKRPKHKPAAKEVATAPGADAESKPKIVRTETLSFDNWTVSCAYTERTGAKPHCSGILRLAEKVNNVPRVVFTWVMGEQQSKLVSVISMPAGVLIGPGVDVKIGDAAVRKYNYSLCAPDHCEAIISMDAPVIAEIKRAPTAAATVIRIGGQSIKFTVNMKGFDRALAAITKQ
jgi:invasion protein IalB